jgi:hypothetical protein
MDRTRRTELQAEYRRSGPEAGVYRIVNGRTGRALLASSANLASVQGKLDFAQRTGNPSILDRRLHEDGRAYGPEVFALEVLDRLETTPDQTSQRIREDLATLEELWRERQDPSALY